MEYFTYNKYKDIFNIYIYGFACTNELENRSMETQTNETKYGEFLWDKKPDKDT